MQKMVVLQVVLFILLLMFVFFLMFGGGSNLLPKTAVSLENTTIVESFLLMLV